MIFQGFVWITWGRLSRFHRDQQLSFHLYHLLSMLHPLFQCWYNILLLSHTSVAVKNSACLLSLVECAVGVGVKTCLMFELFIQFLTYRHWVSRVGAFVLKEWFYPTVSRRRLLGVPKEGFRISFYISCDCSFSVYSFLLMGALQLFPISNSAVSRWSFSLSLSSLLTLVAIFVRCLIR